MKKKVNAIENVSLDKYFSTDDVYFNECMFNWYLDFKNNQYPKVKPFEIFVEAFLDLYFYIVENKNKPIACSTKANDIFIKSSFNDTEKVILLDKLNGMLFNTPDAVMVYIQFMEFRNDIKDWLEDLPEDLFLNKYDLENIKNEYEKIKTAVDRQEYLYKLLFNYSEDQYKMSEDYHSFFESQGLFQWIRNRITENLISTKDGLLHEKGLKYLGQHKFHSHDEKFKESEITKNDKEKEGQLPNEYIYLKSAIDNKLNGVEVALFHVYMNKTINKTNAAEITKFFNRKSGESLLHDYQRFQSKSKRVNSESKQIALNMIKRIDKVIKCLPEDKKENPTNESKELNKILENLTY